MVQKTKAIISHEGAGLNFHVLFDEISPQQVVCNSYAAGISFPIK